jgi:hypothetical protein
MKKRALRIIHNLLMENNEDYTETELIYFYVKRVATIFGLGGFFIGWTAYWVLTLIVMK